MGGCSKTSTEPPAFVNEYEYDDSERELEGMMVEARGVDE